MVYAVNVFQLFPMIRKTRAYLDSFAITNDLVKTKFTSRGISLQRRSRRKFHSRVCKVDHRTSNVIIQKSFVSPFERELNVKLGVNVETRSQEENKLGAREGWKRSRPADLAFSPVGNRKARTKARAKREAARERENRERSPWTKEQGSVASNIRET